MPSLLGREQGRKESTIGGKSKIQATQLGLCCVGCAPICTALHSSRFTVHTLLSSVFTKSKSLITAANPAAMATNSESSPPPPVIGKIGPYTVFMTPPSTPKPFEHSPPKVLPPPPQMEMPVPPAYADASVLGFLKNAVTKVQTGTSLDCYNHYVYVAFLFLLHVV